MKYTLKQIEFWFSDGINYPKLIDIDSFNHLINIDYDYEQLLDIENELKKLIYHDSKVVSVMNPLYPELEIAVISCELTEINPFSDNHNKIEKDFDFLYKIKDLMNEHNERLNFIYASGEGKLSSTRNNGILYSDDHILYGIETKINQIVKDNYTDVISVLENTYDYELTTSMQWFAKNDKLINLFINRLNFNIEEEINIILRQFIPIIIELKDEHKKKIYQLSRDKLLLLPSGQIRNKAVSILSEMPHLIEDEKLIDYLYILSESMQLNYSYPASQIISKQKNNP